MLVRVATFLLMDGERHQFIYHLFLFTCATFGNWVIASSISLYDSHPQALNVLSRCQDGLPRRWKQVA